MANNINHVSPNAFGGISMTESRVTPNFSAPKGSIHIQTLVSTQEQIMYRNTADGNNWIEITYDCYGDIYVANAGTTLTISATNTWYPLSNAVTFSTGYLSNMNESGGVLFPMTPAYSGVFLVTASVSIDYVSNSDAYQIGVGNDVGTLYANDARQGGSVQSLRQYDCISFTTWVQAYDTTGLQLMVRNIEGTNNIAIKNAYMSVQRLCKTTLYE